MRIPAYILLKLSKNFKYYVPVLVFITIDLVLLALYIKNDAPHINERYDIESNNSFVEFYQYIKWLIIIGCLMLMAIMHQSKKMLVWMGVFFIFLLEDIFRIHETLGWIIFDVFGKYNSQISEKSATLLAVLVLGFILLIPIIWVYSYSDDKERSFSKKMVCLLFLFLFFAFGMDEVHQLSAIKSNHTWKFMIGIIEDGGELIAESIIAGFLCYRLLIFEKR